MSYTFLQEQGEESSAECFSDIPASVLLRFGSTGAKDYCKGKRKVSFHGFLYGMISERSMDDHGKERLISSLAGSRAKTLVPQIQMDWESTDLGADFGPKCFGWFAKYDHASYSWKTPQTCLFVELGEFSVIWPVSGYLRDGMCFQQPPLEPGSFVSAFSSLQVPERWTTPTASVRGVSKDLRQRSGGGQRTLQSDLATAGERGPENPDWTEWLMGWPIGWSDAKPLETGKFQQWLDSHGKH